MTTVIGLSILKILAEDFMVVLPEVARVVQVEEPHLVLIIFLW